MQTKNTCKRVAAVKWLYVISGLDHWTGLLNWVTGLAHFSIFTNYEDYTITIYMPVLTFATDCSVILHRQRPYPWIVSCSQTSV